MTFCGECGEPGGRCECYDERPDAAPPEECFETMRLEAQCTLPPGHTGDHDYETPREVAPPPSDAAQPTKAILHRLWTKAVGTVGYDKTEWVELERLVHRGLYAHPEDAPLKQTPGNINESGDVKGDLQDAPGGPTRLDVKRRLVNILEELFSRPDDLWTASPERIAEWLMDNGVVCADECEGHYDDDRLKGEET